MATITPRYQSQVGTPLGGVRLTTPAVQDGDGLRQVSRALGLVGQGAQLADKWIDERATTEAKDADVKNREEDNGVLHDPDGGFYTLQGNDAVAAAETVKAKINASRDKAAEGLSSRAREKFLAMSDIRRIETLREVDVYTARQQRIYEDGVSVAREGALVDDFIRYWGVDEDRAKASLGAARKEMMDRLDRSGVGGEAVQRELMVMTGDAYAKLATSTLDDNPERTQAIVEQYGQYMNPLDRARLESAAKDGIIARDAMKIANGEGVGGGFTFSGLNSDHERGAHRRLKEAGLSDVAIAGVLGTARHESGGFRPDAVNPRDGRDGSDSIGLFQHNGARANELREYAARNGLDWRDSDVQMRFFLMEVQRDHPEVWRKLRSAKTVEEAVAAMNDYERPKGWKPGGDPSRVDGWPNRVAQAKLVAGRARPGYDGVKPGDTLEQAIFKAKAAAGGDPDLEERYVNAAKTGWAQNEAIARDKERRAYDDYLAFRLANPNITSLEEVPTRIRMAMSPEAKAAAQADFSRGGRQTDALTYATLYDMAASDPEAFKGVSLLGVIDKLSPEDFQELTKLQLTYRHDPSAAKAQQVSLSDISAVSKLVMPKGWKDDSEDAIRFKTAFLQAAQAKAAQLGRQPNQGELLDIGRRLNNDVVTGQGIFGPKKAPVFKTFGTGVPKDDFYAIPEAHRKRIVSDWRARNNGAYPSYEQAVDVYRRAIAAGVF